MKRKTTIKLTIIGLLGLAEVLYAANNSFFNGPRDTASHDMPVGGGAPVPDTGTHFFFSAVHNPDPSPNQAGPLGVAAAPADLIDRKSTRLNSSHIPLSR